MRRIVPATCFPVCFPSELKNNIIYKYENFSTPTKEDESKHELSPVVLEVHILVVDQVR